MPRAKKSKRKRRASDESYAQQITREATLARERIGKTRVDELKWLLKFAYTDLDKLSEGSLRDIGWEFAAFGFDELPNHPARLLVLVDYNPPIRVGVEEVQRFQQIVKKGFDSFFYGEGWEMTQPEVFMRLQLGRRPHLFESIKGGFPHAQQRRIRHAYDLVKTEWERLRLCDNPKCKGRFVDEKKGRTRYCSPRCANYIRVTVHRAKKEFKSRPEYPNLNGIKLLEAWRGFIRAKLGVLHDEELVATLGEESDLDDQQQTSL